MVRDDEASRRYGFIRTGRLREWTKTRLSPGDDPIQANLVKRGILTSRRRLGGKIRRRPP